MKMLAFLALVAILIFLDFLVFKSGVDSFFWQYKTPAEKELQTIIIEERRRALVVPDNKPVLLKKEQEVMPESAQPLESKQQ